MAKVLIVEDEAKIARFVELELKYEGYEVEVETDGTSGLARALQPGIDVLVLDVMLPGLSGMEVCQKIRESGSSLPIIMLTAKVEDADKIMGLTIGADDYITKPFNPLEVAARVKTQLRRYVNYNNAESREKEREPIVEFDINGLVINRNTHKCTLYGKAVTLTPIEFSILWYLCENRGKVISSEELFEKVWGGKFLDNNNTVMAHIGRLREKLKEPARNPKFIKTVWGVGYTIEI